MIDRAIENIFVDQWRVIFIVSGLLLLMAELGFRFGLRLHRAHDEPRKGENVVIAIRRGPQSEGFERRR